ncbi:MAG: aldehyde ferredoxin oxidoreductase family protein [Chloroflexi bacterium]|nr:aldehyde ferredoxin oxidoreductase family protein [Chloroflexota bacterium]
MTAAPPANRSYTGQFLRVDLTRGVVSVEPRDELTYRRYLGGWGFIGEILLREVPPGCDPLGPDNRLIFATGVVSGLPLSGLGRHAIGAKSPLTGGFGASEVGGFWGAELKKAGFDGIIIQGRAQRPVYLWIHDGQVELRDASHLWGIETKACQEAIRHELEDPRIRVAQIGIGGGNLVRYACLMNDLKDAAGRGGMGAVMGSKNLKAIAVRGSGKIGSADPKTLSTMGRWLAANVDQLVPMRQTGTGLMMSAMHLMGNLPIRNFRDGDFAVDRISAPTLKETYGVGMEGCYACAVRCKKVVQVDGPDYQVDPAYGGPEYEALGSLGSCCGVDDLAAVCKANELCNAYTLDAISTGVTVAFAMECFEQGLLTLADTDGVELRFGNGAALVTMVERIARREGLGDLLAQGSKAAAQAIGQGAEAFAMQVKGQEYPMHEPRLKRGLAIGYAVSPTGADHCHALQDTGYTKDGPALLPLKEMGVVEPLPLEDLGPRKARMAWYFTLDQVAQNCAVACIFVPWAPTQHVEIIKAATGWNYTVWEWMKAGERALQMARVFNAREGFTAADDWLAPRSFHPPTSGTLGESGAAVQPQLLGEGLAAYYGIAGWEPDSGLPSRSRLEELELGWVADLLPQGSSR